MAKQQPMIDQESLAFSVLKFKEDANSNLLRYYVDLDDIMGQIEYLMQGYTWDAEEQDFKKIVGKEHLCLFNELGLDRVMFVIRSNVNKNTLLANYTWALIKLRMRRILVTFNRTLCLNQKRFDIKTYDLEPIIDAVESILLSVYTRAMDGLERSLHKSAVKGSYNYDQQDNIAPQQQQQQKV